MLGSTALDVAIGLVFVYLAVSLACSAINEVLEGMLKHRSKDLELGIKEMLATKDGDDMIQKIYDHPLISSLFKGNYETASSSGKLPSYIPSRNFALALLDVVRKSNQEIKDLRGAAQSFGNAKVSGALVALIDNTEGKADQVREQVEHWFDSSMDRVSGWYKRRSQVLLVSFGIAIAGAANVDSIDIVRTLSTDGGVRDALVSQAHAAVSSGEQAKVTPQDSIKQLRTLGLPIGWDLYKRTERAWPNSFLDWIMKTIGVLVTGIAVSLGAPFWFDLLNKFMVVRSTVKPEEKSQQEKPKQ